MATWDATNPDIAETYRYDEYGQPYFYNGDGQPLSASQADQDYLYTGRQWDGELEVYYYRARYYGPSTERFFARDSLRDDKFHNQYTYVECSPTSFVDPTGRSKLIVHDSDATMIAAQLPGAGLIDYRGPVVDSPSGHPEFRYGCHADEGCSIYALCLMNKWNRGLSDEQYGKLVEDMAACMAGKGFPDIRKRGYGGGSAPLFRCKEQLMGAFGVVERLDIVGPLHPRDEPNPFKKKPPPIGTGFVLDVRAPGVRLHVGPTHAIACMVLHYSAMSGDVVLLCQESPEQGGKHVALTVRPDGSIVGGFGGEAYHGGQVTAIEVDTSMS